MKLEKLIKKITLFRLVILFLILITIFKVFACQKSSVNKEDSLKNSPEQKIINPTNLTNLNNRVFNDIKFPQNFFFGTASSDFQTTGGNGLTDWNKYINDCVKSKKCLNSNDENLLFVGPNQGTLFLERYKEDFDLAEKMGIQVHRLSLEWARIEPEEGKWDKKAINKYKEIFLYMKSRDIEPMICLNHFALPLWVTEKGGLSGQEFSFFYSRYAKVVAQEIGHPLKIKWWLTFNEPQVMLLPYTKGTWPPDKPIQNFQDSEGVQRALKVASNLIDAHRLSYRAIHNILKGHEVMVSYASAPALFYPHDPDSPLDKIAYNIGTALETLSFDYAVGRVDRDFVGLNYYGRVKLKFHISFWDTVTRAVVPKTWLTEEKPFAIQWEMPIDRKQGNRPKEFYPQALYDLIMKFKDFNLPIVITENGISDPKDKFREEFIVIHLKAVHDAIKNGANVVGYQYWALTDTWEWDGKFSNFGLIEIDRSNNFKRKLRSSANTYSEIIKTHAIKKELLEKHRELLMELASKSIGQDDVFKYDNSAEKNICSSKNPEFNKAVVSLTFDDGWEEIYQNAIPILDKSGVRSTQYVSTNVILNNEPKYMGADQVLAMDKNNHEIGSHAVHHQRFTDMDEGEMDYQFSKSRDDLLKMGVKSVDTFAYPYGEYTDYSVDSSRKSGYKGVRVTIQGMNDRQSDKFLLYAYELQNWMTFDPYIKRLVDRAKAEKKWLILIFHQIAKPDYPYYTSPEDLSLLINYLVENKVPVMTVRDVLKNCYQ